MASDQIRQMVNFILQEAHEKANEIRVKVSFVLCSWGEVGIPQIADNKKMDGPQRNDTHRQQWGMKIRGVKNIHHGCISYDFFVIWS